MTDTSTTVRRTVTLRSPSGEPVLAVGALPAAAAVVTALALAPRLTALAALAALQHRMSLSIDAPNGSR